MKLNYYLFQIKNIQSNGIDKHTTDLLLNNVTLILRALEDLECLPLKQRLQDCLDYVQEMSIANEIEDLQNIKVTIDETQILIELYLNTNIKTFALKELGTSILELLEPLQKYRRSLVSAFLSEKLALYSSQLCTSFEMLVQLAQEQHRLNAPIYVINYIFNLCFFNVYVYFFLFKLFLYVYFI